MTEERKRPWREAWGRFLSDPLSRHRRPKVNLALQGGGAHGALTWGVLDALLERDALEIDGISGTSAGAVNAVALAAGLLEGGAEGAREKLDATWRSISKFGSPASYPVGAFADARTLALSSALMERGFRELLKIWSPFDLSPIDINPLKEILEAQIDFERLRQEAPVQLFIAATEVTSGRARIFRNNEVSVEAVMASACLPVLSPAVRVGRFRYWDGGFSANPDLITLIAETSASDTVLVQISPDRNPTLPTSSEDIAASIARLTFNQPLRHHIETLHACRGARPISAIASRSSRRLASQHTHLIDASPLTLSLAEETKGRPDWPLIESLRDEGRAKAQSWIDSSLGCVGRRSSTDLHAKFVTDRIPFD